MMNRLLKALLTSLWFVVLCAPIMGIHINPDHSVTFRWHRLVGLAIGVFFAALLWHWYYDRKALGEKIFSLPKHTTESFSRIFHNTPFRRTSLILIAAFMICMPFLPVLGTGYQVSIMISGLIYVMLALGLNIIVGFAGQLVLGYAAFYGIGAYTYGLLHLYFGLGFWICLPIAGIITTICGLGLGLPVLRLRGDYLAIVTLAFGEIVKNVMNACYLGVDSHGLHFSLKDSASLNLEVDGKVLINGAMGITGIKKASTFTIGIVLVIITLLVILNLVNSRAGRAIMAIRDNEIAARSVGIPITKYKLMAFVTSAVFAGVAGVLYALNYSSLVAKKFDYNTSILILVFVVLGGIGSLRGSVIAATVLTVLPELLRSMNDYRMLIYAIVLIIMMLFNQSPQMIALRKRLTARFRKEGTDTKAAKEKKGVA